MFSIIQNLVLFLTRTSVKLFIFKMYYFKRHFYYIQTETANSITRNFRFLNLYYICTSHSMLLAIFFDLSDFIDADRRKACLVYKTISPVSLISLGIDNIIKCLYVLSVHMSFIVQIWHFKLELNTYLSTINWLKKLTYYT